MATTILMRLLEEVFPFAIYYIRASRLERKAMRGDIVNANARYETWMKLPLETLDKLIEKEQSRSKAIEDKTSKMTAIFAVALTIGSTFSTALASNITGGDKALWGLMLGIACLYIFLGGWISLEGTASRAYFGYGADWEVEIKTSKTNKKSVRVDALARWEISNIRMSLTNTAARQCVRNGFILFFIGTMIALTQQLIGASLIDYIMSFLSKFIDSAIKIMTTPPLVVAG